MKLGELKNSLSRFPSDMDECEVLFIYKQADKIDYDCLAFVAYIDEKSFDNPCVVLGSMKAALDQMKSGKLKNQDGTNYSSDGFVL